MRPATTQKKGQIPKSLASRTTDKIQNKMKTFRKSHVLIALPFIVALFGSTIYFSSCKNDPCKDVTCQNGGTSVSSGNNCSCNCAAGYEGQFCEIKIPFQGPQNPSFEVAGNTGTNAANWGYPAGYRKGGTGFLPSRGIWYAEMNFGGITASLTQTGVDITHSTTMTFDYIFTVLKPKASATVKILFTSNGTITLWQQTIDSTSTLPIQILNQTISLPSTTDPGKLTIQVTSAFNSDWPNFSIDNIRMN